MKRGRIRALAILLIGWPLAAQPSRITGRIDSGRPVVLRGSRHPRSAAAFDQGPADPTLALEYMTLALKPSAAQQAELDRLLADQQDPSSPNFHKWLTPEQYGDRFGLSRADIVKISEWLRAEGLTVKDVARGRHWIAFSGAAEHVNRVFATRIHRYRVDGRLHYANATEPSIPAALADVAADLRGLDDFPLDPLHTQPAPIPRPGDPDYTVGAQHFLAPGDLAAIYNIAPLYDSGIDGEGQRIAIVGQSAPSPTDFDSFRKRFNLPARKLQTVLVGPDPGTNSSSVEMDLDIEWSGAVARNADIVYVFARSATTAAQYAVDRNVAPVLSMSFGRCEAEEGNPAFRAIAQQANAQGITWLTASGDSGPAGCDRQGVSPQATRGAGVNFLASLPEVTGVGGTMFQEGRGFYWAPVNGADSASALFYIPEVAWNENGASGLGSSGGGPSLLFPKPSWQSGPGVPDDNARDVPDVALSSAGHDAYYIISKGAAYVVGGTSAAAPAFAGVVALLNQYLVSNGSLAQPGLGNINPNLYRLARNTTKVFHDIADGDNIVPCAQSSPQCSKSSFGFAAGPGYDPVTGLGSVNVHNLATRWNAGVASTTTVLTASPAGVAWGGAAQLTATVTSASGVPPTGVVNFESGGVALGSAALSGAGSTAAAVLTVNTSQFPVGSRIVSAIYPGSSDLGGSAGSAPLDIGAPGGSAVVASVSPSPIHASPPDAQGLSWTFFLRLTETAGVSTRLTGITKNGAAEPIAAYFASPVIQANGSISGQVGVRDLVPPATTVYGFTGADANGRAWSQQITASFTSPLLQGSIALSSAPGAIAQNRAADPACQWSRQLNLEERNGFKVQLLNFTAGPNDWSEQIQQLFGTTRLAPFGSLQATVCLPGPAAGPIEFDIGGFDDSGNPVSATLTSTLAAAPAIAGGITASPSQVVMSAADAALSASAAVAVNLTGGARQWSVSLFPGNRTTSWLKVSPLSGTASGTVALQAAGAGLANGVYRATLVFESPTATPQSVSVPVIFVVGISTSAGVAGVANAASYSDVLAPGALMTVAGSELAFSTQKAARLPLPISMAGVSATVNGVAAPLAYVSPSQLNIQVPYETGAGPAVLGVNNLGQISYYAFRVAAAAPGIFTDDNGGLVPSASGKRGQTLLLFMTGDGDVSPPLPDGATPAAGTPAPGLPRPRLPVIVTVGGQTAQTVFTGIPSGVAGATQINFIVPPAVAPGDQPLVVTVGGVASPPVNLTVTE